ncbi:zinc-ribbon domain-containing protein [Alisedimentitalea sp. MJ-SS2]|uniref:zinc-ribbon domain-containing protein n=1 Tax=Aliisedimentitalea sp. MJ-SS2 TaxID=3049795 RepID=UPI00291407D8|nr:zinc-ribbon domain-containing protein [Alisedimentitalea sp. MJ-SS2]MDU8926141.1 zinc-ribbon domain-containing protein [Alisedimentitalea sp. MJ-SS2]
MRLICPNCGAQYEVPDDVIPEMGRDVQCSNCGDTWFQKHPSQDRELAEDLGRPLDDAHWEEEAEGPVAEPEPVPQPEPELEPEPEPEPDPEPEPQNWPDTDPVPTPESEHEPQRRELDPEVRDVLREEAEQEMQARASEVGGLETQPDLGLEDPGDEASRREREARVRMARIRGLSEQEALASEDELADHASRRDLLPDIDEINSTLRKDSERVASAEAESAVEAAAPTQKRGFSRGFSIVLLIFAAFLLLYMFAPQLAEMVPTLSGVLDQYVALVNDGRQWLDQQVLRLTSYLDGLASESGGN